MNELREQLKKLGQYLKDQFFIIRSQLLNDHSMKRSRKKKRLKKKYRHQRMITRCALGFLVFLLFLYGADKLMTPDFRLVTTTYSEQSQRLSLAQNILGKTLPVVGWVRGGTYVLSDFEDGSSFRMWKSVHAKMVTLNGAGSDESAAANVTFYPDENFANFFVDDLLRSRNRLNDWSNFKVLQLTVTNPGKREVKLKFQVTDLAGGQYKQRMTIKGGATRKFEIPVDRVAEEVNIHRIDNFSFYTRPKKEITLYFDDIQFVGTLEAKSGATVVTEAKKRPVNPVLYDFEKLKFAWLAKPVVENAEVVRVPFIVKNENSALCQFCPVEGGIPLPIGEVKRLDQIRVVDQAGNEVSFQARELSRWPDQSLRWIALHFEATLKAGEGVGYVLEYGPAVKAAEAEKGLSVEETNTEITVETGPLQVILSKEQFSLFESVVFDADLDGLYEDDEVVMARAPLEIEHKGVVYRSDRSDPDYRLTIQENGPMRVVLRAEGWFMSESGNRFCKSIVRYYFYHQRGHFKVAHTLVYTGYPANPHNENYVSNKLPANEPITAYGMRLPFAFSPEGNESVQVGRDGAALLDISASPSSRLVQSGYEKGLVRMSEANLELKNAMSGWINVVGDKSGFLLAVRDFRENFPKAFSIDKGKREIGLDLWPREAGALDLSTTKKALGPEALARGSAFGLAKTHELLFDFYPGQKVQQDVLNRAGSFRERLLIRVNPYWIHATGTLGRLLPASKRFYSDEITVTNLFNWAARHPQAFRWYGMLNFGDTLTWWRSGAESGLSPHYGWHPVGRWGWYNCEGVGTHSGALLQFFRTGEWAYFNFGENLSRHIMDIDTVHYNTIANDPRLKPLLNDEFSRVGSMHRHNGDHWGGRNEEASHTNVLGLVFYYYLTGDERVREVIQEVGEFFLSEPFTYTGHPDIAPQRSLANALWGDVLLYELTGDPRFKNAADKIIEILIEGQEIDGTFLSNYDPVSRAWHGESNLPFMIYHTLGAVIEYHRLTQDEEVQEMLVKMVDAIINSEDLVAMTALHGVAYAYHLTGEQLYIDKANEYLGALKKAQRVKTDLILDGIFFDKPIYHRPMAYLYSMPYIFDALEIEFVNRDKRV